MQGVMGIFKMIAVVIAAMVIGNWFLSELKKVRAIGAPWYRAYLTIPGILIILALLSPIILQLVK